MAAGHDSPSRASPPAPAPTSERPTRSSPSKEGFPDQEPSQEGPQAAAARRAESGSREGKHPGEGENRGSGASPEGEACAEAEGSLEYSEYPVDGAHPEYGGYLADREEHLQEASCLEGREDLLEEADLKEEMHPGGKEYLSQKTLEEQSNRISRIPKEFKVDFSTVVMTNLNSRISPHSTAQETPSVTALPTFTVMPLTSIPAVEPSTSSLRDQANQTEWAYDALKSKLRTDKGSSPLPIKKADWEEYLNSEEERDKDDEALDYIIKESFWDSLIDEQEVDNEEDKVFDKNLSDSSYQGILKTVVKEMAAHDELEEDWDFPLIKRLKIDKRRKLRILLKKDFGKFKATVLWIMKKHKAYQQLVEESTLTYHLLTNPEVGSEGEVQKEEKKAKKYKHPVRRQDKDVNLNKEWIQKTKVQQSEAKFILYSNENIFRVIFPDGTGQIHYPSGNLALLICTSVNKFIYIILEDCIDMRIRALINNSGHGTFYDENGDIRLSLSSSLGHYFPEGKHQKAWNWWDPGIHVHAPPFQHISLKINRYIQIQIRSQDKIIFCFFHKPQWVRLNLGTKFKSLTSEALNTMKREPVLEVEPGPATQKIQILLGKMSKILHSLTIPDLESFTEATKMFLGLSIGSKNKP